MRLNNLRNAEIIKIKKYYDLGSLKSDEILIDKMYKQDKHYVGDINIARRKFTRFLTNRMNAEIAVMERKLDAVINSDKLFHYGTGLVITIEWKKSRMWGLNPTAFTNYGFYGSSIGGCGYCKKSTATAQALNDYLPIIRLMYIKKNKELGHRKEVYIDQNGFENKSERGINHFLFGYGSGYDVLPRFEGGVGVESHRGIIEKIGLKWDVIADTDHVNVYLIKEI